MGKLKQNSVERIALSSGVTLARNAAVFAPNLSLEEWREIGRSLAEMADGVRWFLGDWVNAGTDKYEHGRYLEALESTGYEPSTLADLAWIASKFESSRRRDLSWSHHREVASLPPDEADSMLLRAMMSHWTRADLRKQLAAPSIKQTNLVTWAQKWAAKFTPPSSLTTEEKSALKESLAPLVKFYETL